MSAFRNTKKLLSLTLPTSVTEIRRYAFYDSGVEEVIFAEEALLSTIGQYAFANTCIKNLCLPNKLTKIDYHAFENIESLESIEFGSETLHLYGYAFYESGLKELKLPKNVEYIGEYCFGYNESPLQCMN